MYNYEYERQVVNIVNHRRAIAGLPALRLNEELSHVARVKSEDMYNYQYFSHQSPTFGSPFDMLTKFGIRFNRAGENIARGQPTPQAVMNTWMNSAGHRSNILNPYFTDIGVGYFSDGRGNTYWTQLFIA